MRIPIYAAILTLAVGYASGSAFAQDRAVAEPGGPAGKWSTRTPVKPDPSKIKVPPGYKVGVFASGLDTITGAAELASGVAPGDGSPTRLDARAADARLLHGRGPPISGVRSRHERFGRAAG